ncbi:MAG TPA: amidase family protein [Kineosporiaceae bacterium]|nr:amidase family protein [Kineosporiaceae bacterium]
MALTWLFNLTGHPAVSVPAGRTADGCPVGLQLVGGHGQDQDLLRLAAHATGEAGASSTGE